LHRPNNMLSPSIDNSKEQHQKRSIVSSALQQPHYFENDEPDKPIMLADSILQSDIVTETTTIMVV